MKILHVNGAKAYGGNEQQILDICSKLNELDIENAVFCALGSELAARLNHYSFLKKFRSDFGKFNSRKSRRQFLSVIKEYQPDVIHIHNNNGLSLYFFTDILHKISKPVVYSKKGMGSSMSFLSRFKYNYRGIAKIICVSKKTEDSMKEKVMFKRNHHKLCVVPDGIDLNRPVSQKQEGKVLFQNERSIQIGNIANHDDRKDLSVLMNAIHHLVYKLNFSDFMVHQLGAFRKLTPQLHELIKELKISDYIKIYGFVEDATRAYEELDIFVMTSKHEGGPSSLLEAMRFQMPVISTDVGIVPDAVIDGLTGYSVPVKDYEAIAERLFFLCQNSELRKEFGENGYQHFLNHFTAQKTAEKTLEVYRGVL